MLNLGLTAAEFTAYKATLLSSHRSGITVDILDRNERPIASLEAGATSVLGGQVDVDTDAAVSRQLKLTILDPKKKLHLTPDKAGDYSVFADNFIRVYRNTWVPELDTWIKCPVFTGPITLFARNHPEVSIEALGKESLSRDPYLLTRTVTIAKGAQVHSAIRQLMTAADEWNLSLSPSAFRLSADRSIPKWTEAWPQAKSLAALAGGSATILFYDGLGRLRFEKRNTTPVWNFKTGENGSLLSSPDISYDLTSFRNHVQVIGGVPREGAPRIIATATLPASHPLSPSALARRGNPRYASVVINDPGILRQEKANEIAVDTLARYTAFATDSDFDALVLPFLEELDTIGVQTEMGTVQTVMRRWTIPLGPESMPIGVNRVLRWSMKYRPVRRNRR